MNRSERPRWHILDTLKRSTRPETILFLDTEAAIFEPDEDTQCHFFRVGVGCLCQYVEGEGLVEYQWKTFADPDELWSFVVWLVDFTGKAMVVAHNMDYDGRVSRSFGELQEKGFTAGFSVMGRSCTMYIWERNKDRIVLLDSMNLWPEKLEVLGKSVGLEKIPVDFKTATYDEITAHCKRDVEILVRMWQEWFKFLDKYDLGSFGYTAASQSLKTYRHKFMHEKIAIHSDPRALDLERRAYRGGRTECFVVGKLPPGEYYQVDVNGLYASMMLLYEYPYNLNKVMWSVSLRELRKLLDGYCVIAEVVISARKPTYPYKILGRNCYPSGTFMTVLTTPELKRALGLGEIRGVGRVAVYDKADLFSEYVKFFQGLRLGYKTEGDGARQRLCKLFLNSLQGKFGQRGREQKKVGEGLPGEVWSVLELNAVTGVFERVVCFGGSVHRTEDKGESRNSFPAIPAHVSAYGRMYMWMLIETAGSEHVFYTDTDSLIVDQEGYDNLAHMMDPDALGMLKLEGMAEDVSINARKDYQFGEKRTLKGIKTDAEELVPGLYRQWHFTTFKYDLREQILGGVTAKRVCKRVRRGTVAGEITQRGEVAPPRLELDAEQLLRFLERADMKARKVWRFDPTYLEGRMDLAFLQEQREFERWWTACLPNLARLASQLTEQLAYVPVVLVEDPLDLALINS